MNRTIILITILVFGFSFSSLSQNTKQKKNQSEKDTISMVEMPERRNVLKWNLTPMIWSYQNINISYERVTSSHGSFSVNAGYFVLPMLGGSIADSFDIQKNSNNWGFSVSGDKRYYFKKRNTGLAPDGLYWGIFGSVHYYEFESSFKVVNSTVASGDLILNGNLGIISAGIELGYQFVLKNNLTIDLIFIGPALSTYSGKLGISGNLDVDENSEYIKGIYDVLVARFPGVDKLLDEKSIKDNGTMFSLGPGLRYMIQIGYRF
ncbi:MAG: DUF3575 domain-containing protein [Bacteroidota bacterium]